MWSPIAGGLLTGKYRRDSRPSEGRHLTDWGEPPIYDEAKTHDVIDAVVEVAEGRGVPPVQVALAWLLARPGLTSAIVGARDVAQIEGTLPAADLKLSAEELSHLDKVSSVPLPYPLWHQAGTVRDRLSVADRVLLG